MRYLVVYVWLLYTDTGVPGEDSHEACSATDGKTPLEEGVKEEEEEGTTSLQTSSSVSAPVTCNNSVTDVEGALREAGQQGVWQVEEGVAGGEGW